MDKTGTRLQGSVDLSDLAAYLVSEAAMLAPPSSPRRSPSPAPASPSASPSTPHHTPNSSVSGPGTLSRDGSRVGTHQFDAASLAKLRSSFFSATASKLSSKSGSHHVCLFLFLPLMNSFLFSSADFSRQNNMITMELDKCHVWDVMKVRISCTPVPIIPSPSPPLTLPQITYTSHSLLIMCLRSLSG